MPNPVEGFRNITKDLPSSKALQTSLYNYVSWLIVESPLMKPGRRGDNMLLLTK